MNASKNEHIYQATLMGKRTIIDHLLVDLSNLLKVEQ